MRKIGRIEITGYITEDSYNDDSFTLKITSDKVENEKGNHPEVSKETKIFIAQTLYPNEDCERFEEAKSDYRKGRIKACTSISRGLKKGDRVRCSVFIVDRRSDNGETTFVINRNPNDIETYTKFNLWLDPNPGFFERLEVDTPETLKFRKRMYYTDRNKKKCEKIIGVPYSKYIGKWWINKNPKLTFPMIGWIQIRTTASNLWKRFTKGEPPINIAWKIMAIVSTIIAVWALFFKDK